MPCSGATQGAQTSLVMSSDVDYTVPVAPLPLPVDTTPVPFSIAAEPLETAFFAATCNTKAQLTKIVKYTIQRAVNGAQWLGPPNRQYTDIVCVNEKLELNDCGSYTTIDPKTAHGACTSSNSPKTFHHAHVEHSRLTVCIEYSLQDLTVSPFWLWNSTAGACYITVRSPDV